MDNITKYVLSYGLGIFTASIIIGIILVKKGNISYNFQKRAQYGQI